MARHRVTLLSALVLQASLAAGTSDHDRSSDAVAADSAHADWPVEVVHDESQLALPRGIFAEPSDASTRAHFLPYLRRAFGRYPADFFESIDLDRVVLCHHLRRFDEPLGAHASHRDRTIYFSIGPHLPPSGWTTRCIHHEIYHFIDHALSCDVNDSEWNALNDPSWSYLGRHDPLIRAKPSLSAPRRPPGFISQYAMTSAVEDKAEVFAWFMGDPYFLRRKADFDAIVESKAELLVKRLTDHFPDSSFLQQQAEHR